MELDIREKPYIGNRDVAELNFFDIPDNYAFRKYFREGLRSHILEFLDLSALRKEASGIVVDGVKMYPRAKPLKMLRLFRNRFSGLEEVFNEIGRFKTVLDYLGSEMVAASEEFVVSYRIGDGYDIMLCGLQEYIDGEAVDPWRKLDNAYLKELMRPGRFSPGADPIDFDTWVQQMRQCAQTLVSRVRRLILEAHLIPDLAGVGNLIVTPSGRVILVDINNISQVVFSGRIQLDDKGYPACDKSVEILWRLDKELLSNQIDPGDPIYGFFITPDRLKRARMAEREFLSRA